MAKKKTCFVIGPIGKAESEIREWADIVYDQIISPSVKECGYTELYRADKISRSGMITIDIMQHLLLDDLVVADLTKRNSNVFYELGVRHAARKTFIQLIDEKEDIPFDMKDLRTIKIGIRADKADRAREELNKYIPEVEKTGEKIFTPVSLVAELEIMKATGDEQLKTLAEILPRLASIENSIQNMKYRTEDLVTVLERKRRSDYLRDAPPPPPPPGYKPPPPPPPPP